MVVIHRVNAVLFGVDGFYRDRPAEIIEVAQAFSYLGIVACDFRNYVLCACERVVRRFDSELRIYEFRGEGEGGVLALSENFLSQRFKTFFLCDGRAGAAFRLERTIYIFERGERFGCGKRGFYLVRHLALIGYRFVNLLASCVERAEIFKSFDEVVYFLVVKRAVRFLAVTGDKRDCAAFVRKGNDGVHLPFFKPQLLAEYFAYIHCFCSCHLIFHLLSLYHTFFLFAK